MKNLLALFLATICFTEFTAQTKSIRNFAPLSEASPESVGISTERLNRIDKMIVIIMKQTQEPVTDVTAWKFRQLVF